MASETMVVLRTVKGIDCLGRGGIQALGKRLANASPLRRVLKNHDALDNERRAPGCFGYI